MTDYMALPERAKYLNDWEDTNLHVECECEANAILRSMEQAWRERGGVGQI